MFWGLVLQPGKRYSSTVKETFHVSAAAVDTKSVGKNETGVFPVQVEVDGQALIICNLSNQCLNISVDLLFEKGTELTFMTTGKANIHLTGYTVGEEDSEEDMSNDDEASESGDSEDLEKAMEKYNKDFAASKKNKSQKDLAGKRKSTSGDIVASKKSKVEGPESSEDDESSGDDLDNVDLAEFSFSDDNDENDDEDDDDQDDSSDDEASEDSDVDDSPKNKKNKKEPQQPQHTPKPKKEQPVSNKKQDKTPGSSKKPEKLNKSISQDLTNGVQTKAEKKAQKKSLSKGDIKTPKGNESATSSSPQSPKKQSMEGGVVVEELKSGNGPIAKPGKMVSVYYTGRLKNNNRVFDQSNSGAGFKFRLGRGEVIKGWDVALNGMKVGSKRRITLPPAMAYGAKGSPPSIPPNSSLVFDVELKSVN